MRYLVYLGYYSDDNTYTKIGESKDIYSRTCSYNTSDPINDFKVICLIELDTEEDMHNMELYLLLHYDDYKARHDVNYKHRNPDNEWITIRPTKTDITYIVKDNIGTTFRFGNIFDSNKLITLSPNCSIKYCTSRQSSC